MLALFVLCSAPALAAQWGEGPYLFLKTPSYLAAWKGMLAGSAIMPRPSMGRPRRQRAWQWGAKPTRSLGRARRMNCGDNQLNVLFSPGGKRAWVLSDGGKESWLGQPDAANQAAIRSGAQ